MRNWRSWPVVLQIVWYSSKRKFSQWSLGLHFHRFTRHFEWTPIKIREKFAVWRNTLKVVRLRQDNQTEQINVLSVCNALEVVFNLNKNRLQELKMRKINTKLWNRTRHFLAAQYHVRASFHGNTFVHRSKWVQIWIRRSLLLMCETLH